MDINTGVLPLDIVSSLLQPIKCLHTLCQDILATMYSFHSPTSQNVVVEASRDLRRLKAV